MGQQVMFQRETLLALLALVGPVGRVQQQMRVQAVLVGEILAAVDANVRTLAGVDPGVGGQVVFQQKRLAALVARVGTLFGRTARGVQHLFVVELFVVEVMAVFVDLLLLLRRAGENGGEERRKKCDKQLGFSG
jgi:hypothetical protein